MNKENIKKIIKYIILLFLVLYISFSIFIISIFNIGKKFINKENIIQAVDNVDIKDFINNKLLTEEEYINIKNE